MSSITRNFIYVLLLCLTCVIFDCQLYGISNDYQNYSTAEGLSHRTVSSFCRDSKGFLWIGTNNGLNRFDGYRFKHFNDIENDTTSLGANIVTGIVEDKNGFLWIGTNSGIRYFDPKTEKFQQVRIPNKGLKYSVFGISVDEQGRIWCAIKSFGCIRISLIDKKTKIEFFAYKDVFGTTKYPDITQIQYNNGFIWLGGVNCIARYNIKSHKLTYVKINQSIAYIANIKKGVSGKLFFVDGINGIHIVNPNDLSTEFISIKQFSKSIPGMWNVLDVEQTSNDSLWVAAAPGLFLVTPNKITLINRQMGASVNFEKCNINSIYIDKEKTLWLGTYNFGLFSKPVTSGKFKLYQGTFNNELTANDVCVSNENQIVYGSTNGLFIAQSPEMLKKGICRKIYEKSVNSIKKFDKDRCLIIVAHEMFFLYYKTEELKHVDFLTSTQCGTVDNNNIIWVGYWGQGITGYDVKTGKRYHIDFDKNDASRNIAYTICGDPDGSLWVGSFGAGLIHVQNPLSTKPKLTFYEHQKSKNSISQNEVLSLFNDGKGTLWIGTCGKGLNKFDVKTGVFTVFNTNNGLKNNAIESIIADKLGNIWFTSSVLSKYDIHNNTFTHFSTNDGIRGEFHSNSCSISNDGILYFGGDNGIVSFNPITIILDQKPIKPILTCFRIFGKEILPNDTIENQIPLKNAISYVNSIQLQHNLNSFSVEFACMQMYKKERLNYSYKLEGIENNWMPITNNNLIANYSGLPPGKYIFKVRSSYGTSNWSEPAVLIIEIIPPWWQTIWFKLIFILSIIICISIYMYLRIRRFKLRNKVLKTLVQIRTNDLEKANNVLSEQSTKLQNQAQSLLEQNNELKQHQTIIDLKNAQLEEALDSKDKLIGIIAHDFKNPLSGIFGLASLLKERSDSLSIKQMQVYIEGILTATTELNEQMNIVLEWARSQMNSLVCKPIEINIETIINDAILLVNGSSTHKNISISTQFDFETNVLVDPRMLSTVIRNLLINAIKFTPIGGKINIIVQEFDTGIEINILDSGIGMNADILENIFKNQNVTSQKGTDNEEGFGLGLQICRSFVEKNNGTISVKSIEDEGSVFTVVLPLGIEKAMKISKAQISGIAEQESVEQLFDDIEIDKSINLLIIDDNNEIVVTLKSIFDQYYNVFIANDGKSGLQLARNLVPNVIISDINMPYLTGIELCKAIRLDDMTKHIPTILITSSSTNITQTEINSYQSGADDFIEKPFDNRIIFYKIKSILDNQKKRIDQTIISSKESGFILPESQGDLMMQRIVEFINNNFTNSEMDVNAVAEKNGISRAQLWRKFKSSTGSNLSDYILDLRMKLAKEMLMSGKYRTSEIAYDVGFTSAAYFTKCFSKYFGESPKDYIDK